ncbi:DUF4320 family protein [Bacillus subtilis]|uniref:DUF4320 family protein n=1 Tax=Bacillus subtilis group TaxID=653685 RepID=UPI001B98C807|nr:DUF4320 family protein [Bacillus subtilis]MEC2400501.1 DUF4320 family protein [Bacillus subtilis]MED4660932.1 DUF4320 family protein [Bacillus subtilis]MED4667510.1 DUF4320 family protein [Bacillus subtilis]WEZ26744.1 DUF4320 family protein [Bacillus subtilis]CAF1786293.1 hypothetical protein NRS6107_04183 [Bacillus subtilis]
MRQLVKSHLVKKIFKDNKGNGDIIVFMGCTLLGMALLCFILVGADYIVKANELNDIADTTIKDAVQINGGLTPEIESYAYKTLENKGYKREWLSISGTQKGTVNYGDEMKVNVTYKYYLPFFESGINFKMKPFTINAQIDAVSLEVVR